GVIWIARLIALALALLVSFSSSAAPIRLVLALAVTATTTLTGHAADWGDLSPTALCDWVHVLAMASWAGGLIGLGLAVLGPARAWPPALLGAAMRRFSRLAATGLLLLVVTGSYAAWVQLPGVSALWTTTYGRALAVKLFLVVLVVGHGAINRYAIVPRLGRR